MKLLYFTVFSLFCRVILAVPAPGRGALKGFCNNDSHCRRDECCVSFVTPRGKRAPPPPGLRRFVKGRCQKRGTEKSQCYVNPFGPTSGLWYGHCSCDRGFFCDGDDIFTRPLGELGRCRARVTGCFTAADCSPSECCVSKVRPIGKRAVDSANAPGTYKPMGTSGASCLVRQGSGRPTDRVYVNCPCVKPLNCRSTGMRDIPLGEVGVCEYRFFPYRSLWKMGGDS